MAMGSGALERAAIVLIRGMALASIGAVAGVALALGLTRLLAQLLFIDPQDPLAFAAPIALLAVCAVAACLVPAWRAIRGEPGDRARLD